MQYPNEQDDDDCQKNWKYILLKSTIVILRVISYIDVNNLRLKVGLQ